MAVFGTSGIKNLPRNIADGLVAKTVLGSTVAALSGRKPQRFGSTDIITFTGLPKAEFVEEGAQKGSSTGAFGNVTAVPHKAQVTVRFNEEVKWADDDYQLGVLDTLAEYGSKALARALDLGLYYRINPATGTAITSWTNYLNTTTNRVEVPGTNPQYDILMETAAGLVINQLWPVNGVAFDPSFAWLLSTARYADGRKKFPELGLGNNVTDFSGIPASTSNTVSGQPEAADLKIKAILGDFQNGIYWGVQKEIPLQYIEYGDPDGQGDLKRNNQIALRLEMVYGWYVFADRFAIVEDQVA